MSRIARNFSHMFSAFNAAIELAAAVENHRAPSSRALRVLGIPEQQFRAVNY